MFLAANGPQLINAVVDGLPIPPMVPLSVPGGMWGWGFSYSALPTSGIDVTLIVRGTGPLVLRLIDQSDGLAGIPGLTTRPDWVATSALPSDSIYVGRTVRV